MTHNIFLHLTGVPLRSTPAGEKWVRLQDALINPWEDRILNELIQDASALIEADRKVVKALVESDFENLPTLISKFRDRKIRVQTGLSRQPAVEGVDDSDRELLARVQRKFPTDNVIEKLECMAGENISFYELSEEEASELGSELLYSWISHFEFVRNMFKVNTLIFRTTIPLALRRYILEARNCFALEQYNAVISLCRTILEAAAKDLCEKEDFFELHGGKIIEINPNVFNQLIRAISSGKLKKRAVRLYYCDACPVVHGDRLVDANEALRVLREITNVVQELYSSHGY